MSKEFINFGKIAAELEDLTARLGEVPEVEIIREFIQGKIDEHKADLAKLADDCLERIDYARSQAEYAKKKRDKWAARAGHMNDVVKTTKQLMLDIIKSCPDGKLRGSEGTMQVRKNPMPSLKIIDKGLIPNRYFEEEVEYILDTEELKADLAEGIDIPGVMLLRGEHVWIG